MIKLYIDDVRTPPKDWVVIRKIPDAINFIIEHEDEIEVISLDHDAGQYAINSHDYIYILDWLEETGRRYPIHIHSMNAVGRDNMRAIIQRNGWREINNV